jgi:hypothetical protein
MASVRAPRVLGLAVPGLAPAIPCRRVKAQEWMCYLLGNDGERGRCGKAPGTRTREDPRSKESAANPMCRYRID